MTCRLTYIATVLFILTTFSRCKKDEESPSNLVFTVDVSTDGSGTVTFNAIAENAKYYEFFFGDVQNETPTRANFGSAIHTYTTPGEYTVTVEAHANEKIFITESQTITVDIFINIPANGYSTPENYSGMTKIWAEEFGGTALNEVTWKFEIGDGCPNVCGWGNNEQEYYKKENTLLKDGFLIIEAKRESQAGRSYTSSRIITKGNFEFKYGRVDVRAVLPKGQGIWPAIWMLGNNIDAVSWPKCGEIDIMEMIGGSGREKTIHGTAHWDNSGQYASYGSSHSLNQGIFADEFHVFSIVWDSNKIIWYMDDIKYHEIDITPAGLSEFRNDFFLILNVAVGGNWPGNPDGGTIFPQRMIIDYIRIFQ